MSKNQASDAVGFDEVLRKEREQLDHRRTGASCPSTDGYVGLAFSGGGIRSATFNLGILQGLVQRGLLPYIDYLSTVSGGGYLGSWLHGVIRRYFKGQPGDAELLLSPAIHPKPGTPETDPISFLRKYSSYLAPELGLFSADFWVILVIWFRNIFLNLLILVPLLAGISLAAMLIGFLGAPLVKSSNTSLMVPGFVGGILLLIGAILAALGVRRAVGTQECQEDPKVERGPAGIGDLGAVVCATSVLLASYFMAINSSSIVKSSLDKWTVMIGMAVVLAVILFFLQWIGGFLDCYRAQHKNRVAGGLAMLFILPAAVGAVTAPLLYGALYWIATWQGAPAGVWHTTAWGAPLIMLVCLASAGLHIGLMGTDFPDFGRESLARMGAYINIAGFLWALLFAIGVFGPYWFSQLGLHYGKTAVTALGSWLAITASGVLSGKSGQTSGNADTRVQGGGALEWIGKIAPTAFMVGFLLLDLIRRPHRAASRILRMSGPTSDATE